MDEIIFLTWEDVMMLHRRQLELYGGQDGFIAQGVVESAVAQPQQTMFGEFLHDDIAHMATAYLFHLATTQGFLDGNKRTALACALAFLGFNGYAIEVPSEDLFEMALSVANNQMSKDEIAEWFRDHMEPIDDGS